jgi:hypothetical protein
MPEFEPKFETDIRERADVWLSEVRAELEKLSGVPILEPGNDKFLERISRGLELSDRHVAILAKLLDHREAFYEENGIDIILEQFYVLRLLLDRSAGNSSE